MERVNDNGQLSDPTSYRIPSFWRWFLRGVNSKPGYRRLLSWFIVLDVALGYGVISVLDKNKHFTELASDILIPLVGVFVGVSFTWGGAAQSIMDSDEIRQMGAFKGAGGYSDYPYSFQSAILVLFVSLVLWGFAGMGIWDTVIGLDFVDSWVMRILVGSLLFGFLSMCIRTCWQMISFSHELLVSKNIVLIINAQKNKKNS